MLKRSCPRHAVRRAVCVAGAVSFAIAANAIAQPGEPDSAVSVYATHYRWASQPFDDLDVLEATVMPRTPRSVGLYACGGDAARLQRAAAHRFRHLYLDLRVLDVNAPLCAELTTARPTHVAQRLGAQPLGIDDEIVDRWWRQLLP